MRSAPRRCRRRRLDTGRLFMLLKSTSRVGAAIGAPAFLGKGFVRKMKVDHVVEHACGGFLGGWGRSARARCEARVESFAHTPAGPPSRRVSGAVTGAATMITRTHRHRSV